MRHDEYSVELVLDGVYSWKRMSATYRNRKIIYYPPKSNKERAWYTIGKFLGSQYYTTPQINVPARLKITVYDSMIYHDLDNIAKMIMDSLQPLVIADDRLIDALYVKKAVIESNVIPQTHISLIWDEGEVVADEVKIYNKASHLADVLEAGGYLVSIYDNTPIRIAEKYNKWFIRVGNKLGLEMTWKAFRKFFAPVLSEHGHDYWLIRLV